MSKLPSKKELDALLKESEDLQAQMDELVEKKKKQVTDILPELFKQPTDEEIVQVVAGWLSDKSSHHHIQEIIDAEGADLTPEDVIEIIKEPLTDKSLKWVHSLFRRAFNKLNTDLKLIKDSQIFTPQGRPEGRTEYTEQLYARVRARAMELGYYKTNLQSKHGDIKKILQQLVEEFKADGLNTPDSIKNCLKE